MSKEGRELYEQLAEGGYKEASERIKVVVEELISDGLMPSSIREVLVDRAHTLREQVFSIPYDEFRQSVAEKTNRIIGACLPDDTSVESLFVSDQKMAPNYNPDWREFMQTLNSREKAILKRAVGSAYRAYRQTGKLERGTVGELRELSVKELSGARRIGLGTAAFLKSAFGKRESQASDTTD